MVRVLLLLVAVEVVLVVLALIGALSAERRRIRSLPRWLWIVVIVLVPLLGPAAWLLAGRPRNRRAGGATGGGLRPSSPDDDPTFLRSLDADRVRREREQFERWEDDLRRRRNGEEPPGT